MTSRNRDPTHRDYTPSLIMKSSLPLYHICKISCFQPSLKKRNTGPIISNIVSSESSESNLQIPIPENQILVDTYVDTEIMYNHIEKITHTVGYVPMRCINSCLPFYQ